MGTILVIILILLLIGALPSWAYSLGWGYYQRRIRPDSRHHHCPVTHGQNLTEDFVSR